MEKAVNKNGRLVKDARFSLLGMSRGGLEPPTHWLKASCSTD